MGLASRDHIKRPCCVPAPREAMLRLASRGQETMCLVSAEEAQQGMVFPILPSSCDRNIRHLSAADYVLHSHLLLFMHHSLSPQASPLARWWPSRSGPLALQTSSCTLPSTLFFAFVVLALTPGFPAGQVVAVKVRHPGVADTILRDFSLMMAVASLASQVPAIAHLRIEDTLKQFAAPLTEQGECVASVVVVSLASQVPAIAHLCIEDALKRFAAPHTEQ
eukprot:scaffold74571_cov21-Tisochrysis_lutea.AAC.1